MHLASNPSHLEAVDPVVSGPRARQADARRADGGTEKVLPIALHGDAAFAGQGVWAEALNIADVAGYSVGGTIHVIVNNLMGFTTRAARNCNPRGLLPISPSGGRSDFSREWGGSGRGRARGANRARVSLPRLRAMW